MKRILLAVLLGLALSASAQTSVAASSKSEPALCKCKEKGLGEKSVQRQYKPFNHHIGGIELIVYPVKEQNPLQAIYSPKNKKQMIAHIDSLYAKNAKLLNQGDYHILFLWNLNGKRMTDVWVHHLKNSSDAGPLLEGYVFKDLRLAKEASIASGDNIIVLAKEEELRRSLGKNTKVAQYANRDKYMPAFPEGMVGQSFFS